MFSLYRLEDLAELASKGLFRLNSKILKALGKQIANARNGGFDRISLLSNADREADRLLLEILKELNIATAKASEIYAQAAKLAYQDMNKYYAARGLTQIPIDQQRAIVNFVQGIAATTRETFTNLSNTTAIGFRVLGLDGKVRYKAFRRHYHDLVDQAITEVATGQIDYRSAFRHAMRQTADSGIRIIDYESGYSRRLDSAMRQNILDGVKEIAHEVSKQTGEQFGADGVEISAHNNCAPDHLPYQGRQFSKQEFEDIQESLHREFGMWNCRHTIFPIILDLSEPLYTEEERQQMIAQSTAVKEFEGKTYTAYEATQLQRRIETEIRKRKDRAILAKEAGDDVSRRVEQLKINQLQDKYLELSKTFKLPLAKDRMTVAGFRPVKAIAPEEFIKPIEIKPNTSYPQVEVVRDQELKLPDELKKIEPDKIDLINLIDQQYIADLGSVQQTYYSDSEPGKEFIIDLPVHYNNYTAAHMTSNQTRMNRLHWIEVNIKDLIRAIESPEFIERTLRELDIGNFSLSNIVKVRDSLNNRGFEYMKVAISLSKGDSQYHQIITIHPVRWSNLFDVNGNLKDKYKHIQ